MKGTVTTLFLLGSLVVGSPAAYGQDAFQQGTAAYRSGNYEQARDHFIQARRNGNTSPTLTYNLAITYIQLNRLDRAKDTLEPLTRNTEWAPVANFQLAIIAEKQGEPERARRLYEFVVGAGEPAKLVRFAEQRLQKITPARETDDANQDRGLGFVSLATFSDSNAFSLSRDYQLEESDGEDNYTDLFAWGQYFFQGNSRRGWRIDGYAYQRRYSEFHSLDIGSYNLGVTHHRPLGEWASELGLSVIHTSLDGRTLSDQLQGAAVFSRSIGESQWRLSYKPSHFRGGGDFEQLDGWQHRLAARWRKTLGPVRLTTRYEFERSDREDLQQGEEFFSYSPTRHELRLTGDWQLANHWFLSTDVEYRRSEYAGTNQLADTDNVFKSKTRESDRWRWRLKAEWTPSDNTAVYVEFIDTDNDATFKTYTYEKQELGMGVEIIF